MKHRLPFVGLGSRPIGRLTRYARPLLARLSRMPEQVRFTFQQLQLAFDRVSNPRDSSGPVWAEIPATERHLVEQAVLRLTGSTPRFVLVAGEPGRLTVFAPGARLGPLIGAQKDVFTFSARMTMRSWNPRNYWAMVRGMVDTGDEDDAALPQPDDDAGAKST